MDREAAETIALRALIWLAQDDDLLGAFLGASGMSAGEVRMRAQDPDFMVAVLDFVTSDDATVRAFCDAEGLRYEEPLLARRAIPGGEDVHWT